MYFIIKSLLLLSLLTSSKLFAKIINKDDIHLDIRTTYINYDYDKGFPDAEAFASSLKLKYKTTKKGGGDKSKYLIKSLSDYKSRLRKGTLWII